MDGTRFPGRNAIAPITGSATPEMTKVDFWDVDDTLIMNTSEILEYNNYLENAGNMRLEDVLNKPTTISGKEVSSMIEEVKIYEENLYLEEELITQDERRRLEASRALNDVPKVVNTICGLISCPADMRGYPTTKASSIDGVLGIKGQDDFQLTRLNLGEPVLIYHTSADGQWYFAQAHNYRGWIKKTCVVRVPRNIWEDVIRNTNFVITTERKAIDVCGVRMSIDIGTRLMVDGDGLVRVPTRNLDGSVRFINAKLDIETHRGFMPYSTRNLLTQTFKLLGDPYIWGNKAGISNDCSGSVCAIYSCFGILLPRDTIDMRKIERNGFDPKEGIDYNNLQVGSLLIGNGHVMLYLGIRDGVPYAFHNFTSYMDDNNRIVDIFRTEITSISNLRRTTNGNTYEEDLLRVVEIKRKS